jgi:hypothetical protein
MAEATYAQYEQTVEQLRSVFETHSEATRSPNCDKHGIGFNRDNRFAAFAVKISFDSWHGYYGDSGCSSTVHFASADLVKAAFVRYLNTHTREIFTEMAFDLEQESSASKAARIATLEEELARLRA